MSDARALAARMTSQRPVDFREPQGGGTPGLGITGLDVAGALSMGGAGEGETLMVLAKWVQDTSAQARLFYVVYDDIVKLATEEKWQVPVGAHRLRRLTRLAIAEIIDAKTCQACQGRQWVLNGAIPKVCQACNGSGRRDWSAATRYHAVGIHRSNWLRTWARRYIDIMSIVAAYDSQGLRALRRGVG